MLKCLQNQHQLSPVSVESPSKKPSPRPEKQLQSKTGLSWLFSNIMGGAYGPPPLPVPVSGFCITKAQDAFLGAEVRGGWGERRNGAEKAESLSRHRRTHWDTQVSITLAPPTWIRLCPREKHTSLIPGVICPRPAGAPVLLGKQLHRQQKWLVSLQQNAQACSQPGFLEEVVSI